MTACIGSAPSRCAAGEPLAGGPAASVVSGRFCAEPQQAKDGSTVFVAPHGLLIGDAAQEGDGWRLELLASFALDDAAKLLADVPPAAKAAAAKALGAAAPK